MQERDNSRSREEQKGSRTINISGYSSLVKEVLDLGATKIKNNVFKRGALNKLHELSQDPERFQELVDVIDEQLGTLSSREDHLVRLRFRLNEPGVGLRTFENMGEYYCVTPERARQIFHKALRKLQHPSRWKPIVAFLEKVE